jgi:hypothetical protein
MSTETIPSEQAAYAGDEATVRAQVDEAVAEATPLPTWKWKTTEVPKEQVVRERISLTGRLHLDADSYDGGSHWWTCLFAMLGGTSGQRTQEQRLALLRDALDNLDQARPVLVRLIESASAALEPVATGVIDGKTS